MAVYIRLVLRSILVRECDPVGVRVLLPRGEPGDPIPTGWSGPGGIRPSPVMEGAGEWGKEVEDRDEMEMR